MTYEALWFCVSGLFFYCRICFAYWIVSRFEIGRDSGFSRSPSASSSISETLWSVWQQNKVVRNQVEDLNIRKTYFGAINNLTSLMNKWSYSVFKIWRN